MLKTINFYVISLKILVDVFKYLFYSKIKLVLCFNYKNLKNIEYA